MPALRLPDWTSLADASDDAIGVFACALLIARDEYPELDVAACDAQLQAHVRHLRVEVDAIEAPPLKMHAINRHLFEEVGYAGDDTSYYDPRNSYLNQVLGRRLGNPISLAAIQMEVARRLGISLGGIAFPGRFLVRLDVDAGMLVMDPFAGGRPLDLDTLRSRASTYLDGALPDANTLAALLLPATPRTMLVRMLRNLHGVYAALEDWTRAARCADRLLALTPAAPDALRDRGLAYLALGHVVGARDDLGLYLQRHPDAIDAALVRERMVGIAGTPSRRH